MWLFFSETRFQHKQSHIAKWNTTSPGGGGGLEYKKGRGARRLALGCKFDLA